MAGRAFQTCTVGLEDEWREVPLDAGPNEDTRRIGQADLCIGLRTGAPTAVTARWHSMS